MLLAMMIYGLVIFLWRFGLLVRALVTWLQAYNLRKIVVHIVLYFTHGFDSIVVTIVENNDYFVGG
jgi:hypothetical protein